MASNQEQDNEDIDSPLRNKSAVWKCSTLSCGEKTGEQANRASHTAVN